MLMTAMLASQNSLPQWQSGGGPKSPKLAVRSELTVRPILSVQQRLVPGNPKSIVIESQNTLPEPEIGGAPGCPIPRVAFASTVGSRLPVQPRLVPGPHERRDIDLS